MACNYNTTSKLTSLKAVCYFTCVRDGLSALYTHCVEQSTTYNDVGGRVM